jgi:hypothetical protein
MLGSYAPIYAHDSIVLRATGRSSCPKANCIFECLSVNNQPHLESDIYISNDK